MANNLFQLYQRHANWVRAEVERVAKTPILALPPRRGGRKSDASRLPSFDERRKGSINGERFQAANGVGLVVGSNEMQLPLALFTRPGWRGTANFSL